MTTPLNAVVIPAPGRPAPTLEELADRPGLAATFVVKAGDGARLAERPRLAETIQMRCAALLLFEDAAEAAAFEAKLTAARARAPGGRASPPVRRVRPQGAPRPARPVQLVGAT